MYKIVHVVVVTSKEKEELASYQLKDVSQVWYTQYKGNSLVYLGGIELEEFKEAFLKGVHSPCEEEGEDWEVH